MVMIVKDHEKQAHGFISVTRPARQPADLRAVGYGAPSRWPPSTHGGGRRPLAAACPWARKARTFALGLHPSEQ